MVHEETSMWHSPGALCRLTLLCSVWLTYVFIATVTYTHAPEPRKIIILKKISVSELKKYVQSKQTQTDLTNYL